MAEKELNILYVDDQINNLNTFKANFRMFFEIFTAESADHGFEILKNKNIQVIITDQHMPVVSGIDFLERSRVEFPDAIRLILTGYSDIDILFNSVKRGLVYRYITKPFNQLELKMALDQAFHLHYLIKENKLLKKRLSKYEEIN